MALTLSLFAVSCGGEGGPSSPNGSRDASPDADVMRDASPDADVMRDADQLPEASADGSLDADEHEDAADDASVDAEADAEADEEVDADLPPLAPEGCVEGTFSAFFGNIHAHTSDSDGEGSPAEAFAHARDAAGLDIMVVTDHLEQLYELWGTPSGEYADCRAAADAVNVPGTFLSGCGFEYGSGFGLSGSTGHNNVFWSPGLFPMVQLDFHSFYDSLVGCADCVGQFNHPRDESSQDWNDFEHHADVDDRLCLFEFNGGGPVWETYFDALDAGWHVSPTFNQDNHSADWGTRNDHRSGFFLPELTRAELRRAMLERRTFASEDRNGTIRLMAERSCWMGSVLSGVTAIEVSAEATDPDPTDTLATVELFGPGRTLLRTVDCAGALTCIVDHSLSVTAATYVVARATQTDGEQLVSAPIWAEP